MMDEKKPMNGIRVLVVENDVDLARGILGALGEEGLVALWAESGQEGLQLARTYDPRLIALESQLPDRSGCEICRQLRSEGCRMPILLLAGSADDWDQALMTCTGADDWVAKPLDPVNLVFRVRALVRRFAGDLMLVPHERCVLLGDVEVDLALMQVFRQGQAVDLTPTGFRLLCHLVSHPDREFQGDELIKAVWGYVSDLGGERILEAQIRCLWELLEDAPQEPRWLVATPGGGYKFERP